MMETIPDCRELNAHEISDVSGAVFMAPIKIVWRQILILGTIAKVEKLGEQLQDAAKEVKQ